MPQGAMYKYDHTNVPFTRGSYSGVYDLFVMNPPLAAYTEIHFTRNEARDVGINTGSWDHVKFDISGSAKNVYVKLVGVEYEYRGTGSHPLTTTRKDIAKVVVNDMMLIGALPHSASFTAAQVLYEQQEQMAKMAEEERLKRERIEAEEIDAQMRSRMAADRASGRPAWGKPGP